MQKSLANTMIVGIALNGLVSVLMEKFVLIKMDLLKGSVNTMSWGIVFYGLVSTLMENLV